MQIIDPSISGWKPRTLDGFIGSVGSLWTRKESDSWAYGFVATAQHTNPAGIVHGGFLNDDDRPRLKRDCVGGRRTPGLRNDPDRYAILTAVQPQMLVEARGRVVRRTATLSFTEGNLTVGAEVVATASAILKIL